LQGSGLGAGFSRDSPLRQLILASPVSAGDLRGVGLFLVLGRECLSINEATFARGGGYTRLRRRTPTRELVAAWCLPVEADRWLRCELAHALAERLQALGRDVVLRSV